jgi:hypothetical protein
VSSISIQYLARFSFLSLLSKNRMSAMKIHDISSQYVLIYDDARIYDMKYMKSMKSCYQLYEISWKYTCIFFISSV